MAGIDGSIGSVLILGASIMQVPAIRLAKSKGLYVHVADGNGNAPFAGLADRFHVVDLKDREGMLELAKRIKEESTLLGVFTAGTDFSATVAWVANNLGLPGISYETALDASIKTRMREVFSKNGVSSPEFSVVRAYDEAVRAAQRIGYPLVIKPVDNMGSRGVRRIDTNDELSLACTVALGFSRSSCAILEQFLDGPEFSIDAVIHRGEISVCGVADRHISFKPYFVELGHTMPSRFPETALLRIIEVFKNGVKALGITEGAAKGDMKLTERGAFVGEIAARLSGGYMSGWTYPYSSGIEVTGLALDIACGFKPDFEKKAECKTAAERAFISIPGIVGEIMGIDRAQRIPHVRDVFCKCSSGDTVVFPKNNVEKCGNIISVHDEYSVAVTSAESAARCIIPRLEPNNDDTEQFLARKDLEINADGTFFPPDAFFPLTQEITDAIIAMQLLEKKETVFSLHPLKGIESLTAVDWLGRTPVDALDYVMAASGIGFDTDADPRFSSRFWNAFFRGSVQGALYVIDSAKFVHGT